MDYHSENFPNRLDVPPKQFIQQYMKTKENLNVKVRLYKITTGQKPHHHKSREKPLLSAKEF